MLLEAQYLQDLVGIQHECNCDSLPYSKLTGTIEHVFITPFIGAKLGDLSFPHAGGVIIGQVFLLQSKYTIIISTHVHASLDRLYPR